MPRILRPDSSRRKQGGSKRWEKLRRARSLAVVGIAERRERLLHSPPVTPAAARPARSIDAIDGAAVRAALARCEWLIGRHAAYLTRLDGVLGDGDHGDNLVIGFRAVREMLAELPASASPGELLRAVGHRLVAAVGGASGPLYGTAFLEAGARIGDSPTIDASTLGRMLKTGCDGLARRGRCTVGDKTMLDALRPASDAFTASIE